MHNAVTAHRDNTDAVVMSAAVADYTPAGGPDADKVKKQDGAMTVALERTVDILADLGRWRAGRPHPVLVGFAAETTAVLEYATRKREAKQVDLIVANDVGAPGAGFEVDTNIATFVTAAGVQSYPLEAKSLVAARIVDFIAERLALATTHAIAEGGRPADRTATPSPANAQ